MSRIASKDTAPELKVRRLLHALGYRFRLHVKKLPGTPDIVLTPRRTAIFVHGCFWHWHGCRSGQLPKSRTEFWRAKLERNKARDAEKRAALESSGWRVLEVWQCQTKDTSGLTQRLTTALGPAGNGPDGIESTSDSAKPKE